MIDIKDIIKQPKEVVITIRITEKDKQFIDDNNINPGELFRKAINNIKEVSENDTKNKKVVEKIDPEEIY